MKLERSRLRHWMVVMGAVAALIGSVAYARYAECWECRPCGCGPDGGAMLCCEASGC